MIQRGLAAHRIVRQRMRPMLLLHAEVHAVPEPRDTMNSCGERVGWDVRAPVAAALLGEEVHTCRASMLQQSAGPVASFWVAGRKEGRECLHLLVLVVDEVGEIGGRGFKRYVGRAGRGRVSVQGLGRCNGGGIEGSRGSRHGLVDCRYVVPEGIGCVGVQWLVVSGGVLMGCGGSGGCGATDGR